MRGWDEQLRYWVQLACVMEVMATKPGNVHPGSETAHAGVDDFLRSAAAAAPVIARASQLSVGDCVLQAIRATRRCVSHNTNLGIVLLLVPLAAVDAELTLEDGVREILRSLTVQDAALAYEAIRLAEPGGMGSVADQDLSTVPTRTLRDCMALAAERDLVSAQYTTDFELVLGEGMDWLMEAEGHLQSQSRQVTWLALRLLSRHDDSLIVRRCGAAIAAEAREMAERVIDSGWPYGSESQQLYASLDGFLRADQNRRNPGTTADLVAAVLFAAMREGRFVPEGNWWLHDGHESRLTE